MIAQELLPKYRFEDCAVLALGDGAAVVGAEIAKHLHCVLTMLLTDSIDLPLEIDPIAAVDNFGDLTYSDLYSPGELEELRSEYFNYIEQQKLQKLFEMNKLLGAGGLVSKDLLRHRNVIVVSDGLSNGFSMHAAAEYLKTVDTKKLIMVTPFASVGAVDQMHILADEIVCLNVLEDVISIDHYYTDAKLPSHQTVIDTIENIILHWK